MSSVIENKSSDQQNELPEQKNTGESQGRAYSEIKGQNHKNWSIIGFAVMLVGGALILSLGTCGTIGVITYGTQFAPAWVSTVSYGSVLGMQIGGFAGGAALMIVGGCIMP